MRDEIQADLVGTESDVHGVLGQNFLTSMWNAECWALLRNTAKIATDHSEQAARDA